MTCEHCGMIHETTCPRIKAIEYGSDGRVRRIEFHPPLMITGAGGPVGNLNVAVPAVSDFQIVKS
jgi:hypothetical protein